MNRKQEITVLAQHIDEVLNKVLMQYKVPYDVTIEALMVSLFKALNTAANNKIYTKEFLEMYCQDTLNRYFSTTNMDLFVQNIEWPPTPEPDTSNNELN